MKLRNEKTKVNEEVEINCSDTKGNRPNHLRIMTVKKENEDNKENVREKKVFRE